MFFKGSISFFILCSVIPIRSNLTSNKDRVRDKCLSIEAMLVCIILKEDVGSALIVLISSIL